MTLTIIGALFALTTGCSAGKDSSIPDTSSGDTDTDTDTDADLALTVTWATDGVTIGVTNGMDASYLLGMVEESDAGWGGEDGLEGPSTSYGAKSGNFDINHDSMADGGKLSNVTTPEAVVANSSTLFTNTINEAGHIGYVLAGTSCVTQNDADGYYSAVCGM